MKNSVGCGAIVLVVSGFICKVFGAMFRLPLTNIIGIKGIGVFQMVMSIYSLLLVLLTGGVTNSLSRLVSSSRARGDLKSIGGFLRAALIITLSTGFALGLVFLLLSRAISSAQGAPEAYESYNLLLFLLPLGALIGVFRGIIQGYENMTPTAISQIIEQVVKFSFGLLFALLGRNDVAKGVYGAFLGITISELLATIYLAFYMLKIKIPLLKVDGAMRSFLEAGLPLSLSGAVIPFTHAIDAVLIIPRLAIAGVATETATSLYGLATGVVGAILNFPLIISLSVAMALLPKITFLIGQNDFAAQRKVVADSFSVMWFFLLPMVVGLMAISKIVYPLVYPRAIEGFLNVAVELTIVGGVGIILTGVMQFLLTLLQSRAQYGFVLLASLFGGVVKVAIMFFTASLPAIGIFAIPISNIALAVVVCLCALIKLGSVVKISGYEILFPLLACLVMFFSIYIFLSVTEMPPLLALIVSLLLGCVIYFTLNIPILRGLMQKVLGKHFVKEEGDE